MGFSIHLFSIRVGPLLANNLAEGVTKEGLTMDMDS